MEGVYFPGSLGVLGETRQTQCSETESYCSTKRG